MTRASVVGAGMTTFGPHERTLAELFAEAAFEALDDAGRRMIESMRSISGTRSAE